MSQLKADRFKPRRAHTLQKVRYSVLYFTWKLPEKGSACYELHGRSNAKDESWKFNWNWKP
ncbi:hypothetical protein B795N_22200 [Marinilactibacillus psychrotolerans]|nr:hypothetical protein B795N_22200 [Marinilactibacillus psychrotolerans]